MLELIVEPYAPFASPDTLASAFVEHSLWYRIQLTHHSDECDLTDLVASVATVFPAGTESQPYSAQTSSLGQYFQPYNTPRLSALLLETTMSSAVTCYINYLVTLRPNIIRPDRAFPIQWWILRSSNPTAPPLAAIFMVCEHTTDFVCCTLGLTWAKLYLSDVSPVTRAIT
jgi:hypothetical protein